MAGKGRVLIIAGSDSSGGAGIQADIKTVTALGGYAMTAITALTVQNTLGVTDVFPVPAAMIEAQARACLDDIGADAIKIGMLSTVAAVEASARVLDSASGVPAVIDPVMVAKGGAALLLPEAVEIVRTLLIPRAAVLTPNLPEAEALTGITIDTLADMHQAGAILMGMGAKAVMLKGGHMVGDWITDLLITPQGVHPFETARIETRSTHGTGCSLASGIANGLALGMTLVDAVATAKFYVTEAIRRAPGFGSGHGPLDHAWTVRDDA